MILIVTTLLVALALDVEGAGRPMKKSKKEHDDQVNHPENFVGGVAGGVYPGPTFATGIGYGPSGFYTFPGGTTTTPPILPTFPGTPLGVGASKP